MNSKLKDLIPLFAIILMLAGAIFLLVALNSGSKKENNKVVENNKTAEVEKETPIIKEENKVTDITDENKPGDDKKEEVVKQTDVTDVIKDVPKSGTSISTDDFILALVDKNIASVPKTQIGTKTGEDTPKDEPKTVTQTPTKTTTTTKTITSTVPTYKVLSSIKYGSYTVVATDNNKIMLQNASSKVLNTLDAAKISSMKIMNGYLYTTDTNQVIKKYNVSNDRLVLLGSTNVGCIPAKMEATSEYLFILKPSGEIVAIRDVNNTFSQAGFVREKDGIVDMYINYNTITATDTLGKTYSYVFDGINFNRSQK